MSKKLLRKDHENYLTLVKLSRKYSCCDTCYCDCKCCRQELSPSRNFQEPHPLPALPAKLRTRRKKSRKTKRSKSAAGRYFTRDCVLLKNFYDDIPKTTPRKPAEFISSSTTSNFMINDNHLPLQYPSIQNLELCENFDDIAMLSSKTQTNIFKHYTDVTEHDQKIISRMIRSRKEKAHLMENAWLAQKYYENEKLSRELIKFEDEAQYKQLVKNRRILDDELKKERFNELYNRDKAELQRLRNELQQKDVKLEHRLKNIAVDKKILQSQRKQNEYRKNEAVLLTLQEQNLDAELKKHEMYHNLEERLSRAEFIRQHFIDASQRRLRRESYMEHISHEENSKEIENFENMKKNELKKYIERKEKRTQKFIEKRQHKYDHLLERAKISASLREIVRRSVSPDAFQFYSVRGNLICDRPYSNLSIIQQNNSSYY